MKNRNNHPVTDALGRLDEETVRACMSEDISPRVTVVHSGLYRKLAVAAACLALTVAVGVTALLPLLRAQSPSVSGTATDNTIQENEPSYPFVRLQVLSYDESESDADTNVGNDLNSGLTIISNKYFRNSNLIIRFDCAEGETVTITSHNAMSPLTDELAYVLAELEKLENPEGDRDVVVDDAIRRQLERKLFVLQRKYQAYQRQNPIIEVIDYTYMWTVPQNPDDYEIIDFTISNTEGEIVGAGSICVGIRNTYCLYQLRTAVLGSERFETPISQEEARAYLDSLHATAEDAYNDMDFSPADEAEGYALARSAVRDIELADPNMTDPLLTNSSHYGADSCHFQWYTFGVADRPETTRRFLLFSDGTYVEVSPEGAAGYDDMLYRLFEVTEWIDIDFSNLILPLTNNRSVTFLEEAYTDPVYGFERTRWVAVLTDNGQDAV